MFRFRRLFSNPMAFGGVLISISLIALWISVIQERKNGDDVEAATHVQHTNLETGMYGTVVSVKPIGGNEQILAIVQVTTNEYMRYPVVHNAKLEPGQKVFVRYEKAEGVVPSHQGVYVIVNEPSATDIK